jgi:ComF family protein
MWSWLTPALDLVFPAVCVLCQGELRDHERSSGLTWAGKGFCDDCVREIRWIRPPLCPTCARPFATSTVRDHPCGECMLAPPPFDSARSLIVYGESIFPLFYKMKYGARPALARYLGELMARAFAEDLRALSLDGIIPIPLHFRRLRQRGFNQSSLMARRLDRRLGLRVWDGFLVRQRWTDPQVGLSRLERAANVRGAFWAPRPNEMRGKRWLLVDDVYTTGATLREAAEALRGAGAQEVHIITAARVI